MLCAVLVVGFLAMAASPADDEMALARTWTEAHFGSASQQWPFSFRCAGRPSSDLLPAWRMKRSSARLDASRIQETIIWLDAKTGLEVRCVAVIYADFPTVEWALNFKNTGVADTPILADILTLDTRLERGAAGEFLLHHNVGSPCQQNDFEPLETKLGPETEKLIGAAGGRPTNSDLSYFNVEWPGQGVIVVVGWPGQWAARFTRNAARGLRLRAGQELTRLKLRPGEEVRSPLIVLQFWRGDWMRSQNVWRRWMLAHNTPRVAGKPVGTHFASTSGSLTDATREMALIDGYVREGIKLDYWIMDAGWHPHPGKWFYTGTWEVDRKRFPRGLREVNDYVHAHGMKTVVWFEPERVTPGSWLYVNHPEWLLGCSAESAQTPQLGKFSNRLLNLGNPVARRWLTDHVSHLIGNEGIDVYRQDFNMDPLAYWRANDAPDRQGITENAYISGYLAYWDELLRRHPHLWIDTCASGGRRNDLETMRRAVPLLRSDYFSEPIGQQCQTHGLSLWMPVYGSGTGAHDAYMIRSSICPMSRIAWDTRKRDLDYAFLRRMVEEFRQIEMYLTGDFYPLTPYSRANNVWMAWQFDRPETGSGVVQAFRRADCGDATARLRLRGVEPSAHYAVMDLDARVSRRMTGRELMDEGLPVNLPQRPAAAVLVYKKSSDPRN
jgi:alpha-galactosidase